jgi:hypothetical protein
MILMIPTNIELAMETTAAATIAINNCFEWD